MRLTATAVRPLLSWRTVAIYASAPCFSFGVVDEIAELGPLAASRRIGLHVDCCLGVRDAASHAHHTSAAISRHPGLARAQSVPRRATSHVTMATSPWPRHHGTLSQLVRVGSQGVLLSCMEREGLFPRAWDFAVPGVTTISLDLHK